MAKLCTWSYKPYYINKNTSIQVLTERNLLGFLDTSVHVHHDQIHFLAANAMQLAIYEATELRCVNQWVPKESSAPISSATFSGNGILAYATFRDPSLCIFSTTNLHPICRSNLTAYIFLNDSYYYCCLLSFQWKMKMVRLTIKNWG